MKKRHLVLLILILMALGACDTDEPVLVDPIGVATLPPPASLEQALAPIGAVNAGAAELLGVSQVGPLVGAAFHANGEWLLLGRNDGTIDVVNALDGSTVQTLEGHSDAVQAFAFRPDGRMMVTGDEAGDVNLWWTRSWRLDDAPFDGHDDWVRSVDFSSDGRFVATGGADGDVRLWGIPSTNLLYTYDYGGAAVRSLAFSNDSGLLAVGGRDGRIVLWNTAESAGEDEGDLPVRRVATEYDAHEAAVMALIFHPDGSRLLSGDFNGVIHVWERGAEDAEPFVLDAGARHGVRSMALNAVGDVLVVAYDNGAMVLWDLANNIPHFASQSVRPTRQANVAVVDVGFLQGGQIVAVVTAEGQVWMWGVEEGVFPTETPTPTITPTITPTLPATATPTITPTLEATDTPEASPTTEPTEADEEPTVVPDEDEATPTADVTDTPEPSSTPTPLPTDTPEPTATPTNTLTPTATLEPCLVSPPGVTNVNVRSGPGTTYSVSGTIAVGTEAEADGQIEASDGFMWLRLADGLGWVREDVVSKTETCDQLPLVEFDG